MTFAVNSQLLSPQLRWVGFLWLSLQILNDYHPTWDEFDFYDFHYRFYEYLYIQINDDYKISLSYDETQWFSKGGLDKFYINTCVW